MENYIVINGKKAELTPEQLDVLGIKVTKANVFDRVEIDKRYFYIDSYGSVGTTYENGIVVDDRRYQYANYCTDKSLIEQRALQEILSRQLWRFSMLHNGDKIDWNPDTKKYYITYRHRNDTYLACWDATSCQDINTVYFYSKEIAQQAIEEIIKPFIAEHPDFKW